MKRAKKKILFLNFRANERKRSVGFAKIRLLIKDSFF